MSTDVKNIGIAEVSFHRPVTQNFQGPQGETWSGKYKIEWLHPSNSLFLQGDIHGGIGSIRLVANAHLKGTDWEVSDTTDRSCKVRCLDAGHHLSYMSVSGESERFPGLTEDRPEDGFIWKIEQEGEGICKIQLFANQSLYLQGDSQDHMVTLSVHAEPSWKIRIATLQETLRSIYLQRDSIDIGRFTGTGEYKLPIDPLYTQLAIIEEERKENRDQIREGQPGEEQKDGRIPTHETIFASKKPIEIEELFTLEVFKGKPKKILILGSAGIGKSTLCQHIAYQWAKGKLWPEFHHLLWIPLREIKPEDTLDSLIEKRCGGHFRLSEDTLLLLDGYDELPQHKEALFKELTQRFPCIVTSRPQRVNMTHTCKLEILGVPSEHIPTYIRSFFNLAQGKDRSEALIKTLQTHSLIHNLSHIPINLALICLLYADDETLFGAATQPTITGLYKKIAEWVFKKHFIRDGGIPEQDIAEEGDPSNHEKVRPFSELLETTAFKLMKKNQLCANTRGMSTQDKAHLRKLGVFYIEESGQRYFIHLTFQEYFAARHLARFYLDGLIKEGNTILQEIKFEPRYTLTLRMIAGSLSQKEDLAALQHFFDGLFGGARDLGKSYEFILFAQCFEECTDPTQVSHYERFVEQVAHYLASPAPLELQFNLLNRNHKLLHHPKIIETLAVDLRKENVTLLLRLIQEQNLLPPEMIEDLIEVLKTPHIASCDKRYAAFSLGEVAKGGNFLPPEAVQVFIDFLNNSQAASDDKIYAVEVLGEVVQRGGPLASQAVQVLIEMLKAPQTDFSTKRYVAFSLGEVAKQGRLLPSEAVQVLIEMLKAPQTDFSTKKSAAKALEKVAQGEASLTSRAVQALIEMLKDSKTASYDKRFAAEVLGEVAQGRSPLALEVAQMLIKVLNTPRIDFPTKRYAAFSLGKLVQGKGFLTPEAVQGLIKMIQDPKATSYDKRYAAFSLGELAQGKGFFVPGVVQGLIEMIQDPKAVSYDKRYAAEALGKAAQGGNSHAFRMLIEILQTPQTDFSAKRYTAEALGKVAQGENSLAPNAFQVLIEVLKDPQIDCSAKRHTAEALAEVAKGGSSLPPEVVHVLIEVLKAPQADFSVKRYAAEALGEVAQGGGTLPPEAVQALTEVLKVPQADFSVKRYAAEALGEVAQREGILPPEVVQVLIEVLKDPQTASYDKRFAVGALGKIAQGEGIFPPEAVQVLIEVLKDPQTASYDKRFAVEALGKIAQGGEGLPPEVVRVLIEMLTDSKTTSDDKRYTAEVLEKMVQGGEIFSPEVVQTLIEVLKDPQAASDDKRYADFFVGEVAEGKSSLPLEAVQTLIEMLTDPQTTSDGKRSAANILGKVAQGRSSSSISSEALQVLIEVLKDSQTDFSVKKSAAEALGEVAKRGSFLPLAAFQVLVEVLKDSQTDFSVKKSAAEALGEVAKRGSFLPPAVFQVLIEVLKDSRTISYDKRSAAEALKAIMDNLLERCSLPKGLFTEACSLTGVAFFELNSVYYISNRRGKVSIDAITAEENMQESAKQDVDNPYLVPVTGTHSNNNTSTSSSSEALHPIPKPAPKTSDKCRCTVM